MRIVIAGAELSEVAAIGGVGEFSLGLATELVARGHEVEVILPLYGYLARHARLEKVTDRMIVPLGVGASEAAVVKRWPPSHFGFQVTLIGAHRHFSDVRAPGDIYEQWPNHEPWIAFARSVVEYVRMSGADPDIIHCMDSHTALVPVFIHDEQRTRWECAPAKPATVLTIHNLLNQGRGDPRILEWAGLQAAYWYYDWFEFHGTANCFKAGLLTADRVNTVSRTYAAEICDSADFGFGLEGVLSLLRIRRRLEWILNGITPDRWRLPGIPYGKKATAAVVKVVKQAKRQRRQELFPRWEWTDDGTPVIASRARWDRQKGVVELVECIRRSLHIAKFVVVTWGERDAAPELARAWRTLARLQAAHPDRLLLNADELVGQMNGAHHYAVADFLLIPSWYEPCGLTQMECQPYGTIPIVRSTGGLADTVSEVPTTDFPSPNGIVFSEPLGAHMTDRMAEAVKRAIGAFETPLGDDMLRHCLQQDNSWSSRIHDYELLYESAADSKLNESIGCLSQRIAIKRSQGDRQGEADALRELGSAYAGRGRRDDALQHWQRALQLMEELDSAEAEELRQLLAP